MTNLFSNILSSIGDKFYSKNSAIWSHYPEGRMTFRRAFRILIGSEKQPEDLRPPKGQRTMYPPIDYESIELEIFNNERRKRKNTK